MALPFVALALAVWLGALGWAHVTGAPVAAPLAPWQASFTGLDVEDQRLYRLLREAIFEAENVRAETGQWPSPGSLAGEGVVPFAREAGEPDFGWRRVEAFPCINYVGEAAGKRWLILFIEPEPGALKTPGEVAPPVDEEHHTLPDGTALHVTVWVQPASTPAPEGAVTFPNASGWTQLVSAR